MTLRAYISEKLKAFGISEVHFVDLSLTSGLDPNYEVENYGPDVIGVALTQVLEECILAPRMSNVSEGGFSASWNFDAIGKYYLWLCRKWGVTPNDDAMGMLGISMITDRTSNW